MQYPRVVIPHRGPRVGVTGGDLHVTQVSASVEHGRDIGVTKHVRVRPADLDAGGFGEAPQAAGGRVPVHPAAAVLLPSHGGKALCAGTTQGTAAGRQQLSMDQTRVSTG